MSTWVDAALSSAHNMAKKDMLAEGNQCNASGQDISMQADTWWLVFCPAWNTNEHQVMVHGSVCVAFQL